MKKKIKIGIPRAFLYYRHHILWKNFFEKLNCQIALSPDTNKEIIALGKDYSIDESCLSSKVYMGHVAYLIDKCDYVLIPRISDYGKDEKVCIKFSGLYDIVKNTFPNLKILNYNIEISTHHKEAYEFFKMGLKITKNPIKIIRAYYHAHKKEKKYNQELMQCQANNLKNNKLKILIIAHPYNIYDKYIGYPITKFFKENNIDVIYADRLDKKIAIEYSKELSETLYWTYSKEIIGAINYYQEAVDGIIFLTAFPCGPDSLINELLIRKIKNVPITNIIIDESSAEAGLQTRLESFIDIIEGRKNNHE